MYMGVQHVSLGWCDYEVVRWWSGACDGVSVRCDGCGGGACS